MRSFSARSEGRRPRSRTLLVVPAVLLLLAATSLLWSTTLPPTTGFHRFVDQSEGPPSTLCIRDMCKRIIGQHRESFTLPSMSAPATLVFSIGLNASKEERSVAFRVLLEKDEHSREVYRKELSKPGWIDERISLPAEDLRGARLSFSLHLLKGPSLGSDGGFGDPVLLTEAREDRPSVILISLDTLRADRVGLYGNASARTPNLDALGRNGVWYRQAYSPSTWTLPSHASLLWGQSRPNVGRTQDRPFPSLTEALRNAGYLTAGFTGGGWMSPGLGFHTGFDTFYFHTPSAGQAACQPDRFDGAAVVAQASAWLRDRGQAPFFLFLHTYEPHDRCPFSSNRNPLLAWDDLSPARAAELSTYYDDLIARTDQLLGRLRLELDKLGLTEKTLLVVTSDHGEAFSEHNQRGHGDGIVPFEEIVRVPLIFSGPKVPASHGAVEDPVSLVNVAPTILSLLDVPRPESMTGGPLPGLGLASTGAQGPIYVFTAGWVAVRNGSWKLIRSTDGKNPNHLYDLSTDPGELKNLIRANPERFAELELLAKGFIEQRTQLGTPVPRPDIDPETKERLRALGYGE